MAQVISFEGYVPTARYDAIPWTEAEIEEGPSASGPWTLIDTLTLSPVDSDPSDPQTRNLTTELASDTPALWYRITFKDATGDSSQPTNPVQNIAGSGSTFGCGVWVTAEDVAATCDAIEGTGDPSVYENAAEAASEVLFALSGRQFSGECGPVTVRPCAGPCGCWPPGRVDVGWAQRQCGWLSQVKLSGYPIRAIHEVKIDGEVLDATEYRLDARRFLTRLADADGRAQRWPACQRMDLADTEEHTFSVSYTYGQDPPTLGIEAAQQLACQIAAAGPDGTGECALPDGTVSITRQGVTIDIDRFVEEGISALPLVGLFLQTYNPARLTKRSTVWTPDMAPYARRVG